ncbi:MAG: type II toxin-antitoxin system VapC family toxin [Candidatus Bathyarchaeia archaeon]
MTVGLDTNVLCYALDPAFPEHRECVGFLQDLRADRKVAVNPTVVHETYHTLVYRQKWVVDDALERLLALLRHPYVVFCSQTKRICTTALHLAVAHNLGGRDSLIIANYLLNDVPVLQTHDDELKGLGQIDWRGKSIKFVDPIGGI